MISHAKIPQGLLGRGGGGFPAFYTGILALGSLQVESYCILFINRFLSFNLAFRLCFGYFLTFCIVHANFKIIVDKFFSHKITIMNKTNL